MTTAKAHMTTAGAQPSPLPTASPWVGGGEAGPAVALDPAEMTKVINRLKRAQGQLAGVVRMLEEGRTCEDVVTQLSAVSKALDRAGFAIISSGLRQCLIASNGKDTVDVLKLQRLFLSLA